MADLNKLSIAELQALDVVVCSITLLRNDLYFSRLANLAGADALPQSKTTNQRHFGAGSTLGGFSPLLDYCPVYRAYSNGDCTQKGALFDWMPGGGQERCDQCRCFEAKGTTNFRSEPACFRMRCLNSSSLDIFTRTHHGASARRVHACGVHDVQKPQRPECVNHPYRPQRLFG